MSKETGVILLGALTIIVATNLLGVPGSFKMAILVSSGLGLIVLGFMLRNELLGRGRGAPHHPFVENTPAAQPTHSTQMQEDTNSFS